MSERAVPRVRVLVADDEPAIRKLYERELRREGYEILLAMDGQEAVRMAREGKPDIVVLDIRMSGVDGVQALHRILEENAELPVILNTAYSSYRENFMTWAAEAYLIKSSDVNELKEKIKEILAGKNQKN